MEIERIIEENGERQLKRLSHTKPEGIADSQKTSYKRRAMTASHSRFVYKHLCATCGAEFQGIKTAKFCSNACRQVRKRQKAAKG